MDPRTKIQKGIQYWKRNGTKAFIHRLTHPYGIRPIPYAKWFEANRPSAEELARRQNEEVPGAPQIAVCPFGSGAETTDADYLFFCRPDSVLEPDALYEMASALRGDPRIDILYTDEGFLLPSGKKTAPCFKPDYSPEYLHCVNYIGNNYLVHRNIVEASGGLPESWSEIDTWDFLLRCCAVSEVVTHLAKPLIHTPYTTGNEPREYKSSLGTKLVCGSALPEGAEEMIRRHMEEEGIAGRVERSASGKAVRPLPDPVGEPKVSILIPNKDERETLRTCVESILERSIYANIEIIVIENNSTDPATFKYYEELEEDPRIKVVRFEGTFNYSRINNFGVAHATGDYLILLNNDTEVITPDWIERMLGYCMQKEIGIVGAKLLYPDGSVQHGGVVIGIGGGASHVLGREAREEDGYLCRLSAVTNVSAVTAACMMIAKETYAEVGGLDESFEVNFNDVTLCLHVRQKGYRIVMHGGVELYHYESKSRGLDTSNEKYKRFMGEVYRFREKWKGMIETGDPYYNPNLSLMFVDCRPCYANEHFAFIEQIEQEMADHG